MDNNNGIYSSYEQMSAEYNETAVVFQMSAYDWEIVEKSEKFSQFAEYIKYRTAHRYTNCDVHSVYSVDEFLECGYLRSVSVRFLLARHDWLKLEGSQFFQDFVAFLREVETRDIRRESHTPQG